MTKQIVNPSEVSSPTGYSHAVIKPGTPVHLAGQVAASVDGSLVGLGDIEAQARQVFANISAVVAGCGGSLDDIVKLTVFVTDLAFRPAVAKVRAELWPANDFPASTFLVVSSLALVDYLVEIEAVAMIENPFAETHR
jgi:enamine deaminase RidA (YjgF/YER057c/UK114 family)